MTRLGREPYPESLLLLLLCGSSPSLAPGAGNAETSWPSPCPLGRGAGCENTESIVSPEATCLWPQPLPNTQAVFRKGTNSRAALGPQEPCHGRRPCPAPARQPWGAEGVRGGLGAGQGPRGKQEGEVEVTLPLCARSRQHFFLFFFDTEQVFLFCQLPDRKSTRLNSSH